MQEYKVPLQLLQLVYFKPSLARSSAAFPTAQRLWPLQSHFPEGSYGPAFASAGMDSLVLGDEAKSPSQTPFRTETSRTEVAIHPAKEMGPDGGAIPSSASRLQATQPKGTTKPSLSPSLLDPSPIIESASSSHGLTSETKKWLSSNVSDHFPPVKALAASRRKRVLVTGGAGFVGSHLVDRLMFLGHE